MTERQNNQPRAPLAPNGEGMNQTYPRLPAMWMPIASESTPSPVQEPGEPSESQIAQTRPEVEAVSAANRAGASANQAQASAEAARAAATAATPPRWPVVTENVQTTRNIIERNPVASAIVGGLGLIGLAICCSGGAYIALQNKLREAYTPSGTMSLTGPEYACAPALDKGGFPNGTTISTVGATGAMVDDTLPGQPTQVAVIPAGTIVTLRGAVHEWLYQGNCSAAQIEQQAQDHAKQAGDTFVSDYHQLAGIGSTGKIPTIDARFAAQISDRISKRTAYRQASWWKKPFLPQPM